MKNINRIKVVLFLITCIFLLANVKVEAACSNPRSLRLVDEANVLHWVNMGGVWPDGAFRYTLTDGYSYYTAYCRQPLYADAGGYYYCIDESGTNDDVNKNAYYAGIVTIFKNGYSYYKHNAHRLGNADWEAAATATALRVYELLWKDYTEVSNDGGLSAYYILGIHKNLAQQFFRANEALVKKATNNRYNQYPGYGGYNTQWANVSWNTSEAINNEVKYLVKLAMTEASKFRDGGSSGDVKVDTKTPIVSNNLRREDPETGITPYTTNVTYKFTAKGFKSREAYIKPRFTCSNCTKYNITSEFYVNNRYIGNERAFNNLDLKSYLNNGDGQITIKIEFKTTSEYYHCQPLNFSLKLTHYDAAKSSIGGKVYSVSPNQVYYQDFYVLYSFTDDASTTTGTPEETVIYDSTNPRSKKIKMCTPNCDDLKIQCDERIPGACDSYEEECTANCDVHVNNVACTKDDVTLDILEGYEIDPDTCVKSEKPNIQKCIINKRDKLKNPYKATNMIENNYCTVSCKEDYHITLPGQQETTSGRYFTFQASVKGTKSCFTSKIDRETFNEDLEALRIEMVDSYNVYNASKTRQNENILNANISKFENLIEEYNNCSTWTMEYNFNPKISFNYEETYMNNILANKTNVFTAINDVQIPEATIQRCTSDTDDTYEACSNGWKEGYSITNMLEPVNKYICYKSGSTYACGYRNISISRAVRMKATIEASGTYAPITQFHTIYSTGAIAIAPENTNIDNSAPLINGLPVGLRTKQGVYSYSLQVENLGEYYDSDRVGRIWGADKSIVSESLKEKDSCIKPGALTESAKVGDNVINKGAYVCSYQVNCPTCLVECDKNHCYNPDCPDNNCPPNKCASCSVECDGCLYNNGNANLFYRSITTDAINPNNRELGSNWQHSDIKINDALELKAYATSNEIKNNGEKIYDIEFTNTSGTGDGTTIDGNSAIHVKLDSKMIKKIQDYNDRHESDGGYANNTLDCYDYDNPQDGKTYKNIYCYSTFIDELLRSDVGSNIQITTNRLLGSSSFREANTQNSGYWTTWTDSNSNKWTVTTDWGLDYSHYKKDYDKLNIGPSWK